MRHMLWRSNRILITMLDVCFPAETELSKTNHSQSFWATHPDLVYEIHVDSTNSVLQYRKVEMRCRVPWLHVLYVVVSLFDATKPSYYIIMIIAELITKVVWESALGQFLSGGLNWCIMAHWSNELYADMFMGKMLIRFLYFFFLLLIP